MTTTTLTYAQREEVLSQKLHELVSTGWEVQSSTATSASVKLPKVQQSIFANLLLTVFTAGLWLFVWMLVWLANPRPYDVHAQVSVDSHGVVKTSKMGILRAKITEDRRWAVQAAYEAGEYESQYPAQDSLFSQPEPAEGPERTESVTSTLLFGSQEYRDAPAKIAVGLRGNLYLLEDRMEFYKGKTLQWSHPKEGISAPETKRFEKFVIYGADGETLLESDSVMRSEQRKVQEYLSA